MRRVRGYTLIELVMFIVIVGVALSAIALVFQQSTAHSADPYVRQRGIAVLHAYMDEILHKRWNEITPVGGGCLVTGGGLCETVWAAGTAYALGDVVVSPGADGNLYQVIQAGTSGAAEPAWSDTADGGVTFAGGGAPPVRWLDLGDRTPAAIGPDGVENRASYDDIDDYNGVADAPPQFPDPAAGGGSSNMPGYAGFSVAVTVIQPANDWNGVPKEDVRRIGVSVTTPLGETLALTAYRVNF